jgi:uncharacterized DUF497 family protein
VGFEWSAEKNASNIRDHGISFQDAIEIFQGLTVEGYDGRTDYGEDRWVSTGLVGNRVVTVVSTERERTTRIISARKATSDECKRLEAYFRAI